MQSTTHAVHKMLAAAAGKDHVLLGEIVIAKIDVVGINDVYLIVVKSFQEMLGHRVWDPDKVYVFLDHTTPASDLRVAKAHKAFREFAREQGCHLVEINEGVIIPFPSGASQDRAPLLIHIHPFM
jgi:homoaconitase/3-isopropylmalate dehydratase large subunit